MVGTEEKAAKRNRCAFTVMLRVNICVSYNDAMTDRQQHNLPSAERTIPDLFNQLNGKPCLCDVTVEDTLADINLATAAHQPGRAAKKVADKKVHKYRACAEAMQAVHLPFAVEMTRGFGESAQQRFTTRPASTARGATQTPLALTWSTPSPLRCSALWEWRR